MKRIISVFWFAVLAPALFPCTGAAAVVGQFTRIEGNVDLTRPGQPAVPVQVGDEIESLDAIRTKSAAKAEITFMDGTVTRLAEKSRIEISQYLLDQDRLNVDLKLTRGKVQNLVKTTGLIFSRLRSKNRFEVHTPTAVVGVRGTNFFTYYLNGISGALFKEGSGYGYNPNLPDHLSTIEAGQALVVSSPGLPPLVRPATEADIKQHEADTTPSEQPEAGEQGQDKGAQAEGQGGRRLKAENGEQLSNLVAAGRELAERELRATFANGALSRDEVQRTTSRLLQEKSLQQHLETLSEILDITQTDIISKLKEIPDISFFLLPASDNTLPGVGLASADKVRFTYSFNDGPDKSESGNSLILRGIPEGDYEFDIEAYKEFGALNGKPWSRSFDLSFTGESTATGSNSYNGNFVDIGSGSGGIHAQETNELYRLTARTSSDSDFSQFFRLRSAVVAGEYSETTSGQWWMTYSHQDTGILENGILVSGGNSATPPSSGLLEGQGGAAWVNWQEAMTGLSGGALTGELGIFNPFTQTGSWIGTVQWALIDTRSFLEMTETAADRERLLQANIPCVQVGRTSLNGSNADMSLRLQDVTFFAYSTGATPRIWATGNVVGSYSGDPSGAVFTVTDNKGVSGDFRLTNWDTSQRVWGGDINGSGAVGNHSIYFNGLAAGDIDSPATIAGTAAGTAWSGTP